MYKSAVGMATCNSGKYIQEVLCHNYLVGFDKIIVVLDQCDDDTHGKIQKLPDEVLAKIDVLDNGPARADCGYQHRAYQTIYDQYKGKVEWLAMFDDDEYFYDSQKRRVNEMLETIPADASQVMVPWIRFSHNNQVLSAPSDITRLAYFTMREDHHILEAKAFIRLDHVVTSGITADWYRVHSAKVSGKTVTFDGKECSLIGCTQMIPEHYDTCLSHYITGSMEDWVIKYRKWKRENETACKPLDRSFNCFAKSNGNIEDTRMSIYVDELKELLLQCK